jgi:transglutaminase-like putative cysteine protease
MSATKTLSESQDKAPAAPVVAKQPETPEKASGPRHATPSTSASAAAPPPNGTSTPARAAEMLTSKPDLNSGTRAGMIRTLQRSVGNNRVSTLLGAVQTKLTVGAVDDPHEREADHVAETMTQPGKNSATSVPPRSVMKQPLIRLAKEQSQPGEKESVDTKMEQRIQSPGSGKPLPEGVRREMETGLGADFSNVKVHDNAANQADAGRLNAKAFTHGENIWLGAGQSASDRKLMAHELTHVVQQQGADVSRLPIRRSLHDLDERLDMFDVPEEQVISLLAGLTPPEKATVLSTPRYRELIAGALNTSEMVRAVNNLGPELAVKLEWVEAAAGSASSIDYGEIRSLITSAPQVQRDALNTGRWKTFFVDVCDNSTIITAVNDLRFGLVTKLEWVEEEASPSNIDYADIQSMVTSATQPERDSLKTVHWRDFFVGVCDNSTIITAVNDLGFDLVTKLEWVEEEASPSNIDYSDIQSMVTSAPQPQRDLLNNVRWRDFFVGVCDNSTILLAVRDLGFPLVNKLEWVAEEVSTSNLSYSDIKPFITAATQPERDVLKTPAWRDWFVGVCTDATMAEALLDLGWDLRTRLEWMGAEGPYAEVNRITFTGNHTMVDYEGPEATPVWESGNEHAMAYTKGANPKASTRLEIDANLARIIVRPVTVRVKEGGAEKGAKPGLVVAGGFLDVPDLELIGLTGSAEVNEGKYNLEWEVSDDGATWAPLTRTGQHIVYWLFATPSGTLYNLAAAKVTKYAAGATSAPAVASAIRHGPRGVDGMRYDPADDINGDPITVFADGVGICTDYANLLTVLALSAGLSANTVLFWGGFESVGKNVWVALGGAYGAINMVNVKSPTAAYNVPLMPISPLGWAFNYHAISRIDGTLQDAALDRTGIDAEAAHAGKVIHLVESTGAPLPNGAVGAAYSNVIPRKDHPVAITTRDYGAQMSSSIFSTDVYVLEVPAGPMVYDVPVTWTLVSGALPPGLTLNSATGEMSGTPTTAGVYTFNVEIAIAAAGVRSIAVLTMTVTP